MCVLMGNEKMSKQLKMTSKMTCPLCGRTERCRMARSRKWKLLFFVRNYSCQVCHSQYVRLFGLFSLLVERGFKPFYIPAFESESANLSGMNEYPGTAGTQPYSPRIRQAESPRHSKPLETGALLQIRSRTQITSKTKKALTKRKHSFCNMSAQMGVVCGRKETV